MAKFKIRHLVAKPQKGGHMLFYWQPSKPLRKAGFLPRRLAERTNNQVDAISQAEALNAEVDRWRAGLGQEMAPPDSIPWLIRLYRSDEVYTELAPKTQRGYDQNLATITAWSARAGHRPVPTIKRRHVRDFYRSMGRTPAKASAVMRVLRLLLKFALDEGIIDKNPAEKQRIKTSPPRQVIWTPEDISLFIETAEALERPSMGLAALLGVNLGQREGDILRLAWSSYDGSFVKLRQRKTGKPVEIPVTEELKISLDQTPCNSPNIVVNEVTGRPYKEDHFRHEFARIRKKAGLEGLWFMDLRRTAVVRLAEAECSIPEIASITGHELDRTTKILETYLPRTSVMASNAITKLEEYKKRPKLEG